MGQSASEGGGMTLGRTARSGSARDLSMYAPAGWDLDLGFQFRSAVIYEEEVPRNCDGEPLFDGDGNPRKGVTDDW